jgi:enoyl-CoA hydratase/carnithine racemase
MRVMINIKIDKQCNTFFLVTVCAWASTCLVKGLNLCTAAGMIVATHPVQFSIQNIVTLNPSIGCQGTPNVR